ncbi:MAG: hypothetical protein ACTHMS_23555 [Jatrophihabitans sp.]|uniref:hypothetical protein n=1 Tax=Jatrophihabitans sp. TaxID=1932789 RepID=UPI003F816EBC
MPKTPDYWYRFWTEMPSDPKIRSLTPTQRWIWACVLAAARKSPEPGVLLLSPGVPMTGRQLADFAGVPTREVAVALRRMREMGLVKVEKDTVLVPRFRARNPASDSSTERVRRHRNEKRNLDRQGALDVDATLQNSSNDQTMQRSKPVPVTPQKKEVEERSVVNQLEPGGSETLRASNTTPTPTTKGCPEHPSGTDRPCHGCRRVREAEEAEATAATARKKAERAARAAAIRACPDCSGDGWLTDPDGKPLERCTHPRALRAIEGGNP